VELSADRMTSIHIYFNSLSLITLLFFVIYIESGWDKPILKLNSLLRKNFGTGGA
jgi:hypothetical protein